jgi:hypothetical protein
MMEQYLRADRDDDGTIFIEDAAFILNKSVYNIFLERV